MGIEPVKKVNISDEVLNQMQKLIIKGYFKLGEKLPSERELCISFGVSRPSIREALKGLVSVGFLEKKSDGTYVREELSDLMIKPMHMLFSSKNLSLEEIFEARFILEIQNSKLAAIKATESDIKQMAKCIKIMENPKSSLIELMDSSVEFHNQISYATNNKILISMYQAIYSILDEMRKQPENLNDIQYSLSFHKNIFEKIKCGDEKGAEEAMSSHISSLFKSYSLKFRK